MVNTDASQPRRNLVLLRCGDESLHSTFFSGSSAPRNWDLHISYYGKAGAPPAIAGEPFTWTADGLTKFDGIAACVANAPFDLDAYDYIAVPDDDVICTRDDRNKAFDLARQCNLAACRFSLHPRSSGDWPFDKSRGRQLVGFSVALGGARMTMPSTCA